MYLLSCKQQAKRTPKAVKQLPRSLYHLLYL